MEVIVPAAGRSSRFPNMRPKYLLFDYKHDMMLKNAVQPFLGKGHRITVGILEEHDLKYNASLYIRNEIPEVNVVVLKEPTKGPADTVYQILKQINYNEDSGLLIKDCDSFFQDSITDGNYVNTSSIEEHSVLRNVAAKSFVIENNRGIITSIVEKSVVSNYFCVGGYKFQHIVDFNKAFAELSQTDSEIFVSHVIQKAMLNGCVFTNKCVYDYIDVGTAEDWFDYNSVPVIFCDIDGTIIKCQGKYGENSYDDPPIILENNVKTLLEFYESGSMIIFTTARETKYREQTERMIKNLGFENCPIIMGLYHSSRILINDYNESNPFPRAIAINLKRDSDNLRDFL